MLRGLTVFPQIEIFGIENPIEFANRVHKGICTPPSILIFKYNCPDLKEVKKVSFAALRRLIVKHP